MAATRRPDGTARRLARPALCPMAAMAIALIAPPARAGFDTGWEAYQRGDFAVALAEWKPLADAGDARAQFNIGVMYDQGKGVDRDHLSAVGWWRKAAEQGFASAQHNLANNLIAGDGVARDYMAAIRLAQARGVAGLRPLEVHPGQDARLRPGGRSGRRRGAALDRRGGRGG